MIDPIVCRIPALSVVALIGASGSGKSSFARKHFRATEVLSSDFCRGLVSDDENDQAASAEAFDVLYYIAKKRLAAGRLVVIDATNVRPEDRKRLAELAREYHVFMAAIVFDLPEQVCHERNAGRPDRQFGEHVVRQQVRLLRKSLRHLEREGFKSLSVLKSVAEVDAAVVERTRLWNDKRDDSGPFDLIGDVHGCREELVALLTTLGYRVDGDRADPRVTPPAGRRALFLGDLVDRGPDSPGVLRLVMRMVAAGSALCVPGNHDVKLMKKLRGRDVRITHGLAETLAQMESEPPEFRDEVATFVDRLVGHYVLDGGRLVVAHAGLRADLQGRASARVRDFALYGETTGETDEYGLPVRYDWANDYRGEAMVVYGHTPVPEPMWLNRTICIDTGCVFGGRLTALRYPERELVSVPAAKIWYEPVKPLLPVATESATPERGDLLDLEDVAGKRVIETRLHHRVTVRAENAASALEVMSRFAIDPRWLVYLPPTMAPVETCRDGDLLERPDEAFAFFRHEGIGRVVCEEKHMGSRAVIVLPRDAAVARKRFGIDGPGAIHTRTGRAFFDDAAVESELLARLVAAVTTAGLWDELHSDWLLLDAEILPWSAKAGALLDRQYAPAGRAGQAALAAIGASLAQARTRLGSAVDELVTRSAERRDAVDRYVASWQRYCWPSDGLTGLAIAPFHLLAAEREVLLRRPHDWQLGRLDALVAADPALLRRTERRYVDLADPASEQAAIDWWSMLTAAGGEGMVVKPVDSIVSARRGLVQAGLKVRGREYLRIIYGPEYTLPANLERLRQRAVGAKRGLAIRESALGLEALHRFVEHEPLYRVHECVFGVLAMESEPIDPRL